MADPPDDFHPQARQLFRVALGAAGFSLVERDGKGKERWDGSVNVCWSDATTGAAQSTEHRVGIVMWPGFPFQQPSVCAMDPPGSVPASRHVAPQPNALCLYAASYRSDTQRGWAQWRTGEEFLERLRDLLVRIHTGEWDETDRPPDLHTSFPRGDDGAVMTLIGGGWVPPDAERSGRFGVWRKSESVLLADSPVAGAGFVAPVPAKETALFILGVSDTTRAAVGAWFRLAREPQPRKTLGAILAEVDRAAEQPRGWALAECRRLIGGESGGNRPVYLALGYPDRLASGAESWLFLAAPAGSPGNRIRWREPQTVDHAAIRSSETVSIDPGALMRRTGPLAKAVAGRMVIVFGVGALGGAVALLLARSGVERLVLVDSDLLRPGNAVRHVGGLTYIGQLKTQAVWLEILTHAPAAHVELRDTTWDPEDLRLLVSRADVVVDATAEQPFNLLLNEVCVRADRPLVQTETMRRAAIGRVRVVRAGRDACLLCCDAHARTSAYPVIEPGDEGEFFEAGCGVPTVEAPAVDVEATANWAARIVLWLLRDTLGPRNHLLIVNEEVPGLSGDAAIVGAHWHVFAPVPGCDSCGASRAEMTQPGEAPPAA